MIAGYLSGTKYLRGEFIPLLQNQDAILYVSHKERLFDIKTTSDFNYNMNAAVVACTYVMSPILLMLPKELLVQIFELSESQGQKNMQIALGI